MAMDSTGDATSQEPTTDDVLFDVRDKITHIKNLTELMYLAGEGMLGISRDAANAITAGCAVIDRQLQDVCDLIDRRGA